MWRKYVASLRSQAATEESTPPESPITTCAMSLQVEHHFQRNGN